MVLGYITTTQAAALLGLTRMRIQVLIKSGRLPAEKIGKIWLIKESDLELIRVRKPGRPRKIKSPD